MYLQGASNERLNVELNEIWPSDFVQNVLERLEYKARAVTLR